MRYLTALIIFFLSISSAYAEPTFRNVTITGQAVVKVYRLEQAVTDHEIHTGLMFRKQLDPDSGMIFILPHPQKIKMWMVNTLIPLDMLFVDDSGRVIFIQHDTVPLSADNIGPDSDIRYVIEINAGDAAKYGIKTGDHVTIAQ